jgi:hypothetical protein
VSYVVYFGDFEPIFIGDICLFKLTKGQQSMKIPFKYFAPLIHTSIRGFESFWVEAGFVWALCNGHFARYIVDFWLDISDVVQFYG